MKAFVPGNTIAQKGHAWGAEKRAAAQAVQGLAYPKDRFTLSKFRHVPSKVAEAWSPTKKGSGAGPVTRVETMSMEDPERTMTEGVNE